MLFFRTIAMNSIEWILNENVNLMILNREVLVEELSKTLENSVTKFDTFHRIELIECIDIPFYHSAILLSEIVNFRFKRNYKFAEIQSTLDENIDISYNSKSELAIFMKILDQEIAKTEFLTEIQTNSNYHEFILEN